MEYVNAVLSHKYRIVVIAMLGSMLVLGASFLVKNIYLASAVVAINSNEKPGGVAPKEYRSGDAIGLLEHDLVITSAPINERDRMMARMNSARFSEIFVNENNLAPYIFYKNWDAEKKAWKADFELDMREAIEAFQKEMRGVEYDEKTGLLMVHFKTRDAQFSADLANRFVKRFNEYSRMLEANELKARREYLEGRLNEVQNLELHRSIFRMMESQLAAETILYARTSYPLEEIQPAFAPLLKNSPKRLTWAALSFVGFVFLGVMSSIGSVLLKKIKSGLDLYKKPAPTDGKSSIDSNSDLQNTVNDADASEDEDFPEDGWIDK